MASLTATGGAPVMRIFWNRDRGRFVVTAFGLPPAAPGRIYQLWAIPAAGAPVSMGTFDTSADGSATLVLPVTAAVASLGVVQATALTEEPAGGSAGPTETPRLVGAWISSQ
jgi:anti-sigma-K factor RskA